MAKPFLNDFGMQHLDFIEVFHKTRRVLTEKHTRHYHSMESLYWYIWDKQNCFK